VLHLTIPVSRKTSLDGRLEIPESLAQRLLSSGEPLSLELRGDQISVSVEQMACTCAKGSASGTHVHHFLSSDELKSLPGGANVELMVDVEQGLIGIELVT